MTLRCQICRTRRSSYSLLGAHTVAWQHYGPCKCGGYHHPHRPGSPCCDQHPLAPLNRAARDGADNLELLDIAVGLAFAGIGGKPMKEFP